MTEKTLLVENPFNLEPNNKKFIQQIEQRLQDDKKQEESNEQIQDPYERLYNQTNANKKFGIIKALEEEAEKIAKAREESIYKDQQNKTAWMANRNKSAKLWETDHDLKKQQYKIKNILKEKRETIAEFIRKKKEITLTNMNIRNKQEETKRLEDFIQNEKESLNARKFYFSNDVQLVNQFMEQVKKAAEDATKDAEAQAKIKEQKKQQINQLNAQNEILDNQISRCQEELKTLQTYKDFIDEIKRTCKKWITEMVETKKKEDQQMRKKIQEQNERKLKEKLELQQLQQNQPSFLLTELEKLTATQNQLLTDFANNLTPSNQDANPFQEQQKSQQLGLLDGGDQMGLYEDKREEQEEDGDDFAIPFEPYQLIEILNQKETDNLQQIQNQTQNREELTKLKKEIKQLGDEKKFKEEQNEKRLSQLQQQKDQCIRLNQELLKRRMFNTNKVKINDGDDLDMDKIGQKIYQIYKSIYEGEKGEGKQAKSEQLKEYKDIESKDMRNYMTFIEKKISELSQWRNQQNQNDPQLKNIQKTIMEEEKSKRAQNEQKLKEQQMRELVEKKNKKRDQNLQLRRKGRAIMKKYQIQDTKPVQQEEQSQSMDDDEKYFQENFDMADQINQ